MRVEEKQEDVLQNIEFAIVETYDMHGDLSDYDVMRALEVLMDGYSGEKIGRPPRSARLSENESQLVERMREMCEWRLGRAESPVGKPREPDMPRPNPITIDEVIVCLKRLRESVEFWNKEGGRQGYLHFISHFIV